MLTGCHETVGLRKIVPLPQHHRYNYPDERSRPVAGGGAEGVPGTTTLIAEADLTGAGPRLWCWHDELGF